MPATLKHLIAIAPTRTIDRGAPGASNGKAAAGRARNRPLRRDSTPPLHNGSAPGATAPSFEAAILAEIPHLRAFAVSLARNPDRADDLVQQTLLRAYSNIQLFDPGSNMSAWLVTILRNEFYSEQRRRRREVPDSDGAYAGTLVVQAGQVSQAECQELYEALGTVPEDMRKALLLIGAYGFSYVEVARACACAAGTIKSRVHRARAQLAATLSLKDPAHFAADPISQSVAIRAEHGRSHHEG